jgi:hypothetical protein
MSEKASDHSWTPINEIDWGKLGSKMIDLLDVDGGSQNTIQRMS